MQVRDIDRDGGCPMSRCERCCGLGPQVAGSGVVPVCGSVVTDDLFLLSVEGPISLDRVRISYTDRNHQILHVDIFLLSFAVA